MNDVHKAAGGAEKDKLNNWLNLDATVALKDEILKAGNPAFKPLIAKADRYGGTYAVKELVYAYAMWISPEYQLKVIRAYDGLVENGVADFLARWLYSTSTLRNGNVWCWCVLSPSLPY